MEKYLSPKNIEDYNKREFWEESFEKYKSNYDWYGNFNDFKKYFAMYIRKSDSILIVGCGNSTLGEKLYDNGYHNITCVDYSEVVIHTMKERCGRRTSLQYQVMDVTKMTFEDGSFDVVLDKACLDAIYADTNDKCKNDATAYMNECFRVLKDNGHMFTISMSQDFICSFFHHMVSPYQTHVYLMKQPQTTLLTNPLFLYVTEKIPAKRSTLFHFLPTDGLLRDEATFTDSNSAEQLTDQQFADRISETRYFFICRNKLRVIAGKSDEPIASINLAFNPRNAQIPNKYSFQIWDSRNSGKSAEVTAALLVPAGNETSPLFCSSESVFQLMESVHADRMVIVLRNNTPLRNRQIDDETAKSDIQGVLPLFVPISGNPKIVIFAPPKEEEANVVESGKLDSGECYVVQDVMLDEKRGIRQLIFTGNIKAVQSEMEFHLTGGRKRRRVFEPQTLIFSIHNFMAASLLSCPPKSKSPRFLVLGVGGGCLPAFLHFHFPAGKVRCADIDGGVVELARNFFKLDLAVEVAVTDGLKFVETELAGKVEYDYIFVDIDAKDGGMASFPPMPFITKAFLQQLKELAGKDGVVVYNVCSSNPGFYAVCQRQFTAAFGHVKMAQSADVNQVLIASDREILAAGEIESHRNEFTKEYMKEFRFPMSF